VNDDERADAWEVLTFTPGQRRMLKVIAARIGSLAGDRDASKADVVDELERACREVTGMRLADFRVKVRCPDCAEEFTSVATRRAHYDPGHLLDHLKRCRHPSRVPELALKSRGRWGWSDAAIERFKSEGQASGRRGRAE
jgi:hypothetical protein